MDSGGNSDHGGDGNGRWLTYGEIAASRGTSRIAAVRLTQRHKWRRQMGNDGLARVFVPPDMLPNDVAGNTIDDVTRNTASGVLALPVTVRVTLPATLPVTQRSWRRLRQPMPARWRLFGDAPR